MIIIFVKSEASQASLGSEKIIKHKLSFQVWVNGNVWAFKFIYKQIHDF